jgi:dihydroorotate dehydrogenase
LEWQPRDWRGLHFDNPLGVAGGVDKNASAIQAWWAMGAGFVEVGTVTPRPQGPNPGRIIDRDNTAQALWNGMGFPNAGTERVRRRLALLPRPPRTPIFVNIGKNRDTANEHAAKDYAACARMLAGLADAFVINVSSPNTSGLRDLQSERALRNLLDGVRASVRQTSASQTPLLLKLSPDLSDDLCFAAVDASLMCGIDGWVVCNTTSTREPHSRFPKEGGVSGKPLAARSKHLLTNLTRHLGSARSDRLIVSVGGVLSGRDVFERLNLGADLVQVYSALVFEGPGFFRHVARLAQESD